MDSGSCSQMSLLWKCPILQIILSLIQWYCWITNELSCAIFLFNQTYIENRRCWLPADDKLNDPDGRSSTSFLCRFIQRIWACCWIPDTRSPLERGKSWSLSWWTSVRKLLQRNQRTVYTSLAYSVILLLLPHDSHDQLVFCWARWQTRIGCWNISFIFYQCDRTFAVYWLGFSSRDTLFSSIWSEELSPCWCSAAKRSLDFRINLYLSLVTMG